MISKISNDVDVQVKLLSPIGYSMITYFSSVSYTFDQWGVITSIMPAVGGKTEAGVNYIVAIFPSEIAR